MDAMPQDWLGLMLVVFILGLKHGMDPDHLATIDGMTRFNADKHPRLSRWSGCLFSLGHGIVVTLVAALVALTAREWSAPTWLEDFGAWISIVFLTLLGVVNLREVLRSAPDQVVRTVGIKGRFLRRFSETSHPVVIASVGAAFALSFDTVSQTALFALTASSLAGWLFSILLGLLFMVGMMVTDGINGLWVARMLRQTGRRALIASRVMGLSIGFLSLAIAGLGMAKYFAPAFSVMLEGAGMLLSAGLVAILLSSFGLALRLSRTA
ncbi:high-affinity nickel-transport protein [Noviherbaspirillum humi]|uniref:Nickel/cobalt efflux system n=1 Tax=Noviherbaspirillum humi TaxID=1688639 RepID=A0A239IPN8_9BURK|nr:nickel transporter [Noviherbaspirillum humi]SNS94384.1 high-affinity nickel-transport protein [Noviherbaspirillum humi]